MADPAREAEQFFEQAVLAQRNGALELADDLFAEALKRKQVFAEAWARRGWVEHLLGRSFNALLHYDQALMLDQNSAANWCNRAIIAKACGLYDNSENSFQRSLKLAASYEAHFGLGELYIRWRKLEQATESFRFAKQIADTVDVNCNLGVVLQARGFWREGLEHLRARFRDKPLPAPSLDPRHPWPMWHTDPVDGKTVLMFAEHGYGDEICALRYALAVSQRTEARVVLAVRPPMYRLARQLDVDEVIIVGDDPHEHLIDYSVPLSDGPLLLGTGVPPFSGWYLPCPEPLSQPDDQLVVGICWSSGRRVTQPETDRMAAEKSVPLSLWEPILACNDVRFVNLQRDRDLTLARHWGIEDPPNEVHDFLDLAQVIIQLDLVITVDTAVAHLAGAMGKPVWNMITYHNIVPWGDVSGPATWWYDSMRLFRQQAPGDWHGVIDKIARELEELCSQNASAKATSSSTTATAQG